MPCSRRDFMKTASIAAAALATGCGRPVFSRYRPLKRKAVILGFDGMDPVLMQRFAKEGLMPNAAGMIASGGFSILGTSDPPQSPVAWANVITGADSGVHGIFDFIARDPRTLAPYLSTARSPDAVDNPGRNRFGRYFSREPGIRNLRQGVAFWDVLEEAGIPCTILRMPCGFPPGKTSARTLSGLGTPDIQGSYGAYTFFTDGNGAAPDEGSAGRIERVAPGVQGHARMELKGPRKTAAAEADVSRVAFDVWVDRNNSAARIRLQGADFILREKEWSDWIRVSFPMAGISRAQGICRFFLKSASGPFALYASPVNLDPADPPMPISSPASYASDIAGRIGPFYTQGMAEDTRALSAGVFDDDLFRDQSGYVLDESLRMFESEYSRFREGLFFFYFSSLDMNQHVFWRSMDATHPLYNPQLASRHGDFIPSLYRRFDEVLGTVLAAEGPDSLVMAISDHGFGSFRRQFHLNRWLLDNGYSAGDGDAMNRFGGYALPHGSGVFRTLARNRSKARSVQSRPVDTRMQPRKRRPSCKAGSTVICVTGFAEGKSDVSTSRHPLSFILAYPPHSLSVSTHRKARFWSLPAVPDDGQLGLRAGGRRGGARRFLERRSYLLDGWHVYLLPGQ